MTLDPLHSGIEPSSLNRKRKEPPSKDEKLDNEVDNVARRSVKVTFMNPRNAMSLGRQIDLRTHYEKNGPIEVFTQGKTGPIEVFTQTKTGCPKLVRPPVPSFPIISKEESDSLIIEAICSGNLKDFGLLLARRPDLQNNINLNVENEACGKTCLLWAVENKQYDILRFLIEQKKAQIDIEENLLQEWSPALVLCLESNCTDPENLKIASYLASNGADINSIFLSPEGDYDVDISSCSDEWRTPVGYYSVVGDLARLKILHRLGANLNALDDNDKTPLYRIVETLLDERISLKNDGEFLSKTAVYLIENGADLTIGGEEFSQQIKHALDTRSFESEERSISIETVLDALELALKPQTIEEK